jgi:hypothetical protein
MSGGLTAGRRISSALLAIGVLLAPPALASATTRYAGPGGTADDTVCVTPDAPKCSIGAAAGGPDVLPADEAVILPGNYSDTAGDLNGDDDGNPGEEGMVQPRAGTVHGANGEPTPVITVNGLDPMSFNPYGAFLLGATTLSRLEIDAGGDATSALTLGDANSVVDRVVARSSRDNAITCNHWHGTLRDSACLSSGSGGIGLGSSLAVAGTFTINVRNVTAVSTGSGSYGVNYFFGTFSPPGPTYTISAKSLIAQGTSQDVLVRASNQGTNVTMNLDHSNYDTATTQVFTMGVASVTPPGTGSPNFNVTDAPLLAADGYHEAAGSPTINAGALDGFSGATDIDGQGRTIGSASDIGADELASPTTTAVSCTPDPLVFGSGAAQCAVTVTDTTSPAPVTFLSGVRLLSDMPGSFVANCETLFMATPTEGTCTAPYTPAVAGTHTITAVYPGDATHDSSQDTDVLQVTQPGAAFGPGAGPSVPSATKKKCKKKKHRGAVAAKKCKKKRR